MNASDWERAKSLLADAADCPAADRQRFIIEHCPDRALLAELVQLVADHADLSEIVAANSLQPGDHVGPYVVDRILGRGGMGEVYRARDSNLHRDVAVKVLPVVVAADRDRMARFRREAQTLAALNHPNIAQIYGIEESAGAPALILELVEGSTLADRIALGAIAPAEAVLIARQIADGLAAAHEQGIIHRDLKPANIKIRDDGAVKVLDFGLAKALAPAGAPGAPGTAYATDPGLVVGTAAYMSPEQALGKFVDRRADIWAFGCILFEMLAGAAVFDGENTGAIREAVLTGQPRWQRLPPALSGPVRDLIEGCLKHDRNHRIGDMSTALYLLNRTDAATPPRPTGTGGSASSRWRRGLPYVAIAIGATVLTLLAAQHFRTAPPPPSVVRFAFTLGSGQAFTGVTQQVAISPDGTQMVYAANGRLYRRQTAALEAQPIPLPEIPDAPTGSSGAHNPVFSPDAQTIAFFSAPDRTIKRVPLTGGPVVALYRFDNTGDLFGMNWGADGLLFADSGKGIMRAWAAGGGADVVLASHPDELFSDPQMLPGGRVLFTSAPREATEVRDWDEANIVVQSLESGQRATVIQGASDARYLPTGHLVYMRGNTLMAARFDLERLLVSGPVAVVEGVQRSGSGGAGPATGCFSISKSGSLMYVPGITASASPKQLATFDRAGHVYPLNVPPGMYGYPRASPDGTRIAVGTDDNKGAVVWIYDLSGKTSIRRLTFGGRNRFPIWSSDGEHVAFQSDREGDRGIFWQSADGTGTAERITRAQQGTAHVPEAWSPADDAFLFTTTEGPVASLWTWSLPDRKASAFGDVHGGAPFEASFSPDGRWVVYDKETPEDATFHVFVEPFPPTGVRYQVAGHFSTRAQWSPRGSELFYMLSKGALVAASVTTTPSFALGNPVPVATRFYVDSGDLRVYDMLPNGGFVGIVPLRSESRSPEPQEIRVVVNWFEELLARVPGK